MYKLISAIKRFWKLHICDDYPFKGLMVLAILLIPNICFGMDASWYSRKDLVRDGQYAKTHFIMANGKEFFDNGKTCASWDYPLGKKIKVTNIQNGKHVIVTVTDRTARRFKGKRVDLAKGAFASIADCKQGIIAVKIEVK